MSYFSYNAKKMVGLGIETPDLATCCDGSFFDVDGIISANSRRIF